MLVPVPVAVGPWITPDFTHIFSYRSGRKAKLFGKPTTYHFAKNVAEGQKPMQEGVYL